MLKAYGRPERHASGNPLDGLIGTILSQNTTSTNSRAAFQELKRRFPTWERCLSADVAEVIDAIRPAGLAELRGPRIVQILRSLREEQGSLDIDFVCEMPVGQAADYLQSFPGVGPKTAACVLLFSCGRQVFPVDTHVDRLTKRLGWVSEKLPPESIQKELQPLISGPSRYALHVNLIAHGRVVCRPRKPRCDECPLLEHCPAGQMKAAGIGEVSELKLRPTTAGG